MRHQVCIERTRESFGSIEIGLAVRKTLELVGFTHVKVDAQFIDTAELSFDDCGQPNYDTFDDILRMKGFRRI